jgi:hypothetical protein
MKQRISFVLCAMLLIYARTASASPICAVDVSSYFTAAMADNRIGCAVIPFRWDTIETADGVYDWSTIDTAIAIVPAGKGYWLDARASRNTPQWVYDAGAVANTYIWNLAGLSGGDWPVLCDTVKFPVPWDATYRTKWKAFIAAMGVRYAGDAKLVGVKLTSFGAYSDEFLFPTHTSIDPIKNLAGSIVCYSLNDTAQWDAIGYSLANIETAFDDINAQFVASFPNVPISAQWIPLGFPHDSTHAVGPIRDLGVIERILDARARAAIPHYESQNNGWSVGNTVRGVESYQEGGLSQANLLIWYVSLIQRLNHVPKRFEIFDIDITLPGNNNILNAIFAFRPARYAGGTW